MKILFCTDGSICSYNAINDILNFVSKDVIFDILYVIDTKFFPWEIDFSQHDIKESYIKHARAILDEAKNIITNEGFGVDETEFKHGDIADTILEKIKANSYDAVVVGSHGKKGLRKWIGSVSKKIVSKSQIPVFVSGANGSLKEKNLEIKKYLIAVDGSRFSTEAVKKSLELFNFNNAETSLVTIKSGIEVFPLEITMDAAWLETCLNKQQELAEDIINKASDILNEKNISFEKKILEGNIAEEILNFAKNNKSSIFVLGSHGREGISEYVLGSISKRILDNAEIPVFIVPLKV